MTALSVPLGEVRDRGPVRLQHGDRAVLVIEVDGVVVAYDDACRHRGSSLATGLVREHVLTCPAHLWRYDLRTGERHDTDGEPLPRYDVVVTADGVVVVDLPDLPPALSLREVLLAHAREGRR
jgi:nitrite reductase/ring-hydroxylating ferredoxin subunit